MRYVLPIASLAPLAFAKIPSLPKTDQALIGPAFLPAANSSFQAFADASGELHDVLREAIQKGECKFGHVDNEETSFSIQVFSAMSNETLFDYHFEAPKLHGSYTKGKLTDETVYRTGSIGKLLTVYAFLVDIGDHVFLEPITKYIPELQEVARTMPKNPVRYVSWEEVTVGSLMSQMSGIAHDFHVGDLALGGIGLPAPSVAVASGFPPLANGTVPQCSSYSYSLPPCSRKVFLDGLIQHPPTFPTYTKAAYSNTAYALLAYAFESITGKNLEEAFEDIYQNRLGMVSSTPLHPKKDVDAIIPHNDTYAAFSYSLGDMWPAGGQYVSTADYKRWGLAILQNSLLSPVLTRRWMKPASTTSQWATNVGAPWEIFRLPIEADPTVDTIRVVDLYTKSGDVGQYSTYFGLDPDHKIGITVLAAGADPNNQAQTIKSLVVEAFVNGAEKAAKEQARQAFTGTFRAPDQNSSITLSVDEGPGVNIEQWISNGTDFLGSELIASNDARLYPAELSHEENGVTYHALRAQLMPKRYSGGPDLWPEYLDGWYVVDGGIYANFAGDALVVGMDKDGIVQSVQSDALRVVMHRVQN